MVVDRMIICRQCARIWLATAAIVALFVLVSGADFHLRPFLLRTQTVYGRVLQCRMRPDSSGSLIVKLNDGRMRSIWFPPARPLFCHIMETPAIWGLKIKGDELVGVNLNSVKPVWE